MQLSAPQVAQLRLLKAFNATSSEAAVNRYSGNKYGDDAELIARASNLNPVMIAIALVPKGLAAARKVPARYGLPKQTLYWITGDGLAVLARQPQGGVR